MKYYLILLLSIHALMHGASELTVEEKVGQMLMAHFNGEEINDDAKSLISNAHIGGIILYNFSNGLHNPQQVRNLTDQLQKFAQTTSSQIPLLIAIDQEGGRVQRLKEGFTLLPSNQEMGKCSDPTLVKELAQLIGEELRAVGINMNLAPVVDINYNADNIVIGNRSFGDTPQLVITCGDNALQGYKSAGVIASLKHFPGHGDTTQDSHYSLPVISHDTERLQAVEMASFKALGKNAPVIMTAHLMIPALDSDHPVTFSEKIITGELKGNQGYQGVVLTDSLVMKGALEASNNDIIETALQSILAGHDLLLLGGKQLNSSDPNSELTVQDVLHIHQVICAAVKEGKIPESQIDASVKRILKLKDEYNLRHFNDNVSIEETVNTPEHNEIVQRIHNLNLSINDADAEKIGRWIWQKESRGTLEGLAVWNEGEEFASFGIGHFIWYPKNEHKLFSETFPELVTYLKENGANPPDWLLQTKECPWNSRTEFLAAQSTAEMKELRDFLADTVSLQSRYIIRRLQYTMPKMVKSLPVEQQKHVQRQFQLLAETPLGLRAIIDYLNFKGDGSSIKEKYNNQGWGLLQVLQKMDSESSETAVQDFVNAAKELLSLRVKNSPIERNENRWMKGWNARLDSYKN